MVCCLMIYYSIFTSIILEFKIVIYNYNLFMFGFFSKKKKETVTETEAVKITEITNPNQKDIVVCN